MSCFAVLFSCHICLNRRECSRKRTRNRFLLIQSFTVYKRKKVPARQLWPFSFAAEDHYVDFDLGNYFLNCQNKMGRNTLCSMSTGNSKTCKLKCVTCRPVTSEDTDITLCGLFSEMQFIFYLVIYSEFYERWIFKKRIFNLANAKHK